MTSIQTIKCAIQSLLVSNALPRDIVIDEIFAKHLYKMMSSLSQAQKESIHNEDFYIKRLLRLYYNKYDHRLNSYMYFLDVFDNDFCISINSGKSLCRGINPYLKNNPDILEMLCVSLYEVESVPQHIYDIWCRLTSEVKQDVYKRMFDINTRGVLVA